MLQSVIYRVKVANHTRVFLVGIIIGCLAMLTVVLQPTTAEASLGQACNQVSGSAICSSRSEDIGGTFGANLVNTMLFALGIVAVIMIIIGGIRYTTASGDAAQTASAKNTILYSVVGLIVAIMAWGIVSFVVGAFN